MLSATLWVRGVFDLVRYFDKTGLEQAINESIRNDTYVAPLYDSMLFLFSDLIPIVA